MNKAEFLALFKVSLFIALLIFVTAVMYDFAVKAYYSSTNWFIQFFNSLAAIVVITLIIMFFLVCVPDIRKAVKRMFGLDEG